jgi:tRNA modification GTPase
MKDLADTICALSTSPGRSGLAVVRVSGVQSFLFFRQIFRFSKNMDNPPARTAMLGRIVDLPNGSIIDEALATCFPSPHSYTGEDLVEFSLHGNPILISALLDSLCILGARIAEPGEFTMRAFLHGRIDLTQAEAVRDIIEATTMRQAHMAARQRSGSIARQLEPVKEKLIEIIVNMESSIEFEDENLTFPLRETVNQQLRNIQDELGRWIESYRRGKIVRDGFSMAIVGRPNVGKSSVFNALLVQDRSIVAEEPGTTRDLVSEYTSIGGVPVRLLDTAGIRKSVDSIEQLGIDRSRQAIADSDAILFVIDSSRPKSAEDMNLRSELRDLGCITVINKSDLPACWTNEEIESFAGEWRWLEVSAKTGSGIERLRSIIMDGLMGPDENAQDGIMVTNLRHCHCLEKAKADLDHAVTALREGLSEEFALVDLHGGLKALGEITGETQMEDLLTQIFSRFCIGK